MNMTLTGWIAAVAVTLCTVQAETIATSADADGMARVPPEGMSADNAGTDPDFGDYSLTVIPFYMDRTEVSLMHWDSVCKWAKEHGYSFDHAGSGKGENHPVHAVDWYDCVKWCNARTEMENAMNGSSKLPCYTVSNRVYRTGSYGQKGSDVVVCNFSADGYRLPTCDEWEFAARGGLSGNRFPWGNTITHSLANYESRWKDGAPVSGYDESLTSGHNLLSNSGEPPYTSSVGSFAANGYGLYDMVGNVWEWCETAAEAHRFFRGGSWDHYADRARCGYKALHYPRHTSDSLGFRAVCH